MSRIAFPRRRALRLAAVLALAAGAAQAGTITVKNATADELQSALAAALDGDTIELKGVYFANELSEGEGFLLADRSNITIRAKGKAVFDGSGLFSMTGLIVQNVDGLTLEGLTFRDLDDGVFMSGSSGVTVRKCKFTDCADSGIEDEATVEFAVEDCKFLRCNWGMACGYDSRGDEDVSITGCKFTSCASYAIDLWSGGALVDDCKIKTSEEGDYGVRIRDGFTGSTVQNCSFSKVGVAIRADGNAHSLLSNKVKKSAEDGVWLVGNGEHVFTGNKVSGSAESGLYIESEDNLITDNVLKGSKDFDIESTFPQGSNEFHDNVFKSSSFP